MSTDAAPLQAIADSLAGTFPGSDEEVGRGQLREAAGRGLVAEGAVGSSVVVVVEPDGERGGALG